MLTTLPKLDRCASCVGLSLGGFPRSRPLAFATASPSRVQALARSASDPAIATGVVTMAFYRLLPNQQCRPGVIVVAALVVVVAIP